MINLRHLADHEAAGAVSRGNRRRTTAFATVFAAFLLIGQSWNLLRPAEYRATARIQVGTGNATPPAGTPAAAPTPPPADFLTQLQVLSSRPLLEKVVEALEKTGQPVAPGTADPAQRLQSMLRVAPAPGTEVVELQLVGAPPEALALALNTLIGLYRAHLEAAHGTTAGERLAQAAEEADRMQKAVSVRRAALNAYRAQSGIVSSERDENATLARLKGLNAAQNTAIEKIAIAEAQLRSMRESASGTKGGAPAKDDPILTSMEQRASQTLEEIRDMERTYTAEFMALDPRARALRARLAELERQVAAQRVASREASLGKAQEDMATARETADRLNRQIVTERQAAQDFSARFAQAKAIEEDLAQIERANREAQERLARLQATERAQRPILQLLEAASIPQAPYRPDYLRDGLYVLAAAFASGLIALWFVELFNRAPPSVPAPPMIVMPHPWLAQNSAPDLVAPGHSGALAAPGAAALPLPAPVAAGTRELADHEMRALLKSARADALCACICMLAGLTEQETLDLRRCDVHTESDEIAVRGGGARKLRLPGWAVSHLASTAEAANTPVLHDAMGGPLGSDDLRSLVMCAALDAGIDGAAEVTPEILRHTGIAWLVRQGVRFSDLSSRVGPLAPDALARYVSFVPDTARTPTDTAITAAMPALRDPPHS